MAGAVATGQTLQVDVAGNLKVASQQDTGHISGSSAHAGVGTSNGNAGLSLGGGHTTGDSAWVGEQTALLGRGSATVNVGAATTIAGAILGSSTAGGLQLSTGSLSVSDIHDSNDYRSTQAHIGGVPGGDWSDQRPDGVNSGAEGSPRVVGKKGSESFSNKIGFVTQPGKEAAAAH